MNITKKVTFIANTEHIEELRSLLKMMIEPSRKEKGCLFYNIYESVENLWIFTVIETWENEVALKEHQNSNHYKNYKSKYEEFTMEKFSEVLENLK